MLGGTVEQPPPLNFVDHLPLKLVASWLVTREEIRAGSTSFGALGENFKWGLFIIKY